MVENRQSRAHVPARSPRGRPSLSITGASSPDPAAPTTAFTFVLWDALGSFSGWPTDSGPPDRAMLVASSVDEPKAIYVWVIAPSGHGPFVYRPDTGEPRAFRLPYSRELHEEIEKAAQMTARGQQVEIRRTTRNGQSGSSGHRPSRSFRVYRLPPPAPPRKDTLSAAGASTTGSG
jgi:hypothetical protein